MAFIRTSISACRSIWNSGWVPNRARVAVIDFEVAALDVSKFSVRTGRSCFMSDIPNPSREL